jgi:hypothetical protein
LYNRFGVPFWVIRWGSAVIWCYIDLFGTEHLSKIILVDQPPFPTSDPHWTQQELEDAGAVITAQQVFDTVAALRSKEAEQVTRQVIDGFVTKQATSEMREWIVQCNLKMPRDFAGDSNVQSLPYRLAGFYPADQPSHPHHQRSSKCDAVETPRYHLAGASKGKLPLLPGHRLKNWLGTHQSHRRLRLAPKQAC